MNVDDEVKGDRIQAQTDLLLPDSLTKVLGAVGLPQIIYAVCEEGMAPREGINGQVRIHSALNH